MDVGWLYPSLEKALEVCVRGCLFGGFVAVAERGFSFVITFAVVSMIWGESALKVCCKCAERGD